MWGVACLFTITGFAGKFYWMLDLTSHFRILYFWILLISLFVFGQKKKFIFMAITIPFLLIVAVPFAMSYMGGMPETPNDAGKIKILQLNVWASNRHYDRIVELIRRENPDVMAFEEMTQPCIDHFEQAGVLARYPYRVHVNYPLSRVILLCRFPLESRVEHVDSVRQSIIVSQTNVNGFPLVVLMTHADRPNKGSGYREQVLLFQKVSELVQSINSDMVGIIFVGDLNTTAWSYPFRVLLKNSLLKNSLVGFGLQPTYPAYVPRTQIPFPFPLLPIDHLLINNALFVSSRRTGPRVGSDHLPVIVEIGIKEVKKS